MAAILINGRAYDWSMIEFSFSNIVGEPITGITAVNWKKTTNIVSNYGVGQNPISRGKGNITYEGSVTIDYTAQTTLQRLSPDGTLEGLGEFDLIITYNHPDSGKTISNALYKCIFSEDGMSASQDDVNLTQEFNLNPAFIEPVDTSSLI